jgi:hypothetical protein
VPTFELTTPVALFWRRAAGRISAEAFLGPRRATYAAPPLALRFADALVIMI